MSTRKLIILAGRLAHAVNEVLDGPGPMRGGKYARTLMFARFKELEDAVEKYNEEVIRLATISAKKKRKKLDVKRIKR